MGGAGNEGGGGSAVCYGVDVANEVADEVGVGAEDAGVEDGHGDAAAVDGVVEGIVAEGGQAGDVESGAEEAALFEGVEEWAGMTTGFSVGTLVHDVITPDLRRVLWFS